MRGLILTIADIFMLLVQVFIIPICALIDEFFVLYYAIKDTIKHKSWFTIELLKNSKERHDNQSKTLEDVIEYAETIN